MFERGKATLRSGCGSWLSVADWFPAVAVTVGRCQAEMWCTRSHAHASSALRELPQHHVEAEVFSGQIGLPLEGMRSPLCGLPFGTGSSRPWEAVAFSWHCWQCQVCACLAALRNQPRTLLLTSGMLMLPLA